MLQETQTDRSTQGQLDYLNISVYSPIPLRTELKALGGLLVAKRVWRALRSLLSLKSLWSLLNGLVALTLLDIRVDLDNNVSVTYRDTGTRTVFRSDGNLDQISHRHLRLDGVFILENCSERVDKEGPIG